MLSQLATTPQGDRQRDEIWSCVTNTLNATVFAKARDIKADFPDEDKFSACPAGALECSISPHVRRPHLAALMGIHTRADAWNSVYKQIKENSRDNSRMHAGSLGGLADVTNGQSPVPPVHHSDHRSCVV